MIIFSRSHNLEVCQALRNIFLTNIAQKLSKYLIITLVALIAITNSASAKTYACTVKQEYSWTHGKLVPQHHKKEIEFTFDSDTGKTHVPGTLSDPMPLSIVQHSDGGDDLVAILEVRPGGDVNIVLRIREWDKTAGTIFLLQTAESSEAGTCRKELEINKF